MADDMLTLEARIATILVDALPDGYCASISPRFPLRYLPLSFAELQDVATDMGVAFNISVTASDVEGAATIADLAALVESKRAELARGMVGHYR